MNEQKVILRCNSTSHSGKNYVTIFEGASVVEALFKAKREGWRILSKGSICPDCAEDGSLNVKKERSQPKATTLNLPKKSKFEKLLERRPTLFEELRAGASTGVLAKELGYNSKQSLYSQLHNHGVNLKDLRKRSSFSYAQHFPRNQKIVEFYAEGHSLEETGAKFGVTRERIRQILKKMGHTDRNYCGATLRPIREASRKARLEHEQSLQQKRDFRISWREQRDKEIIDAYRTGLKYHEIKSKTGHSVGQCIKTLRAHKELNRSSSAYKPRTRLSDAEALERNQNLIKDYLAGGLAKDLSKKYGIHINHVYTITAKAGVRKRGPGSAKWSDLDTEEFKLCYPTAPSIAELAEQFGRTTTAIRARAGVLGLKRTTNNLEEGDDE